MLKNLDFSGEGEEQNENTIDGTLTVSAGNSNVLFKSVNKNV